jgi:diketogulonate reductase-like aldo/keto reductase
MKVKLNNDTEMPALGIGTWEITGQTAKEAVLQALQCGYRLIDTAKIYGNERQVGEAIKESQIDRSDIFVTTKIWNSDHGDVQTAFNKSLELLDVDYIDLYLIHWPPAEGVHLGTWQIMNDLMLSGKIRTVGVSNYNIQQLEELIDKSGITPSVNQIPISPFSVNTRFFQISHNRELIKYCNEKGIVVEAYSPLTRGAELKNPALLEIAQKYEKTTAQILIRWSLQRGFIVIPKSQNKERIEENFDVFNFNIDDEDMKKLNSF